VFTFSLGKSADDVITKEIACETDGMWMKVPDTKDLSGYMNSYYKLFALGLGDKNNKDFVAWVEPYAFSTGNEMGTTVAAPVYDRSVTPAKFLGVVGMDFTVKFMEEIVGGTDSYTSVLN
jgi:hypothetical protein